MATDTETGHEFGRDGGPGVSWVSQTKAFAVRNFRTMLRTKATVIWGFGFPAFW